MRFSCSLVLLCAVGSAALLSAPLSVRDGLRLCVQHNIPVTRSFVADGAVAYLTDGHLDAVFFFQDDATAGTPRLFTDVFYDARRMRTDRSWRRCRAHMGCHLRDWHVAFRDRSVLERWRRAAPTA